MDLLTVIMMGLTAGGIAVLTRSLPWPRRWLSRKPLGCSVCMGGHGAWVSLLLWRNEISIDVGVVPELYFAVLAIGAIVYVKVVPSEFFGTENLQ